MCTDLFSFYNNLYNNQNVLFLIPFTNEEMESRFFG